MRIHNVSTLETLLYATGLSVAILMATGLFMNIFYPIFGISRPLSPGLTLITLNGVSAILLVLSLIRSTKSPRPGYIDMELILSRPALLLYLVPLLTIIGVYFVNQYHCNAILMVVIAFIAIIPVLVGLNRVIPETLYPLAIITITISLLLHTSLISPYLWGYDIHYETFLANLVIDSALWDFTSPGNVNAMLSVVILAPVYSYITGLSLTWVFKLVYPIIFSLVPLGLYHIFQRQTTAKNAFLACFFFTSFITFYAEMASWHATGDCRTLFSSANYDNGRKKHSRITNFALFVVFGASLIVSHYGTSYIYLLSLTAVWLYMTLSPFVTSRKGTIAKLMQEMTKGVMSDTNPLNQRENEKTLTFAHVLFFAGFTFGWYMLVAGGTSFATAVSITKYIGSTIVVDLLNPGATEGLDLLITAPLSPLHSIAKGLHLITLIFIVIGFIAIWIRRSSGNFSREYTTFSFIALLFGISGILVPNFSSTLNTTRLYQIMLIFLSPLCVIGGISILAASSKVCTTILRNRRFIGQKPLFLLSILNSIPLQHGLDSRVRKRSPVVHRPESGFN